MKTKAHVILALAVGGAIPIGSASAARPLLGLDSPIPLATGVSAAAASATSGRGSEGARLLVQQRGIVKSIDLSKGLIVVDAAEIPFDPATVVVQLAGSSEKRNISAVGIGSRVRVFTAASGPPGRKATHIILE